MGIARNLMCGLIEEARYRPFYGTSCTYGRQTMAMTPEAVLKVFELTGVSPVEGVKIETDNQTLKATLERKGMILDYSFFSLLGFDRTISADVSDFEGAEIIVDLNKPIGPEHENVCDLMVDGSLLDNIFDPVTGLRNLARMVRPGGRVLLINMGNSVAESGTPYTMFTGAWFYDFFAANGWADVQVYSCCYHRDGVASYMIDDRFMTREFRNGILRPMNSDVPRAVAVFAEKGEDSTADETPTQHVYRSASEWESYERTVDRFMQSKRPPLLRSTITDIRDAYRPGWQFITYEGEIRRPYEEC